LETLATVIVGGPSAALLFDEAGRERAEQGLRKRWNRGIAWVLASTPEDLIRMVRDASREGVDCAVMLPLVPSGGDDAAMRRAWKEWRLAVARCAVLGIRPVPTYAAVYACLGAHAGRPVEFNSTLSDTPRPQDRIGMRQAVLALRTSCERHPADDGLFRRRLALSVVDWASEAALLATVEEVANTPPFFLAGLLLVDADTTVAQASAWLSWVAARTGLHLELPAPRPGALGLPPLTFGEKKGEGGWAVLRDRGRDSRNWLRRGLTLTAMAVAAALVMGIPYWRVSQDLQRYSEALDRYAQLPVDRLLHKCDAFLEVQADLAELQRRLAQGGIKAWVHELAGAEKVGAAMAEAVAAYQPPRTSLRIDSTATFEAGDARVRRAAARKSLEPAVALLRMNPDLRVRIVGHTDSTGTPQDNLALSLARAQTVRDELALLAGVEPREFDVAGRGATQPRADNTSATGRALNRRVEITLMPPVTARLACMKVVDG